MQYIKSALLSSALFWLVGCASAQKVAVLPPVGPAPGESPTAQKQGTLQVYSARECPPVNLNAQEFFWNNDYGKNGFLHYPAHTAYTILTSDGQIVQKVHNSTDLYDAQPTPVSLAPGFYKIRALAEDYGTVTENVEIPIEIKAGETTAVHLANDWQAPARSQNPNWVRMSNGQIIGWKVPQSEYLHAGN